MADQSPNGEWHWRVISERNGEHEEVLAKMLIVRVPSFSKDDLMPVAGRKFHMACHGRFYLEDGIAIIDDDASGD